MGDVGGVKGPVGFLGLGVMGVPMASRLVEAGFQVRGYDLSPDARGAAEASGVRVCTSPRETAEGATFLVTMLPNGKVVRDALMGAEGAIHSLMPGSLIIEMSSSAPLDTKSLGMDLAEHGVALIDAPVSGGVAKARLGTLAIIAGGEVTDIERARPILGAMGASVFRTGALGSGHAAKALNNYVSAAGLVAACEALVVGEAFGLDPEVLVDVLNGSTGRNNSTEVKLKPHVLTGAYGAGFAMTLMAKDVRTAADLAEGVGRPLPGVAAAAALWEEASRTLGKGADHTAIHKFLVERKG